MALYALYGTLVFNSRARRDSMAGTFQTEATNRGFAPYAMDPVRYPAGTVNQTTTSFSFSYSHTDPAVVQSAETDLNGLLQQNQYTGDFGSQWVSD